MPLPPANFIRKKLCLIFFKPKIVTHLAVWIFYGHANLVIFLKMCCGWKREWRGSKETYLAAPNLSFGDSKLEFLSTAWAPSPFSAPGAAQPKGLFYYTLFGSGAHQLCYKLLYTWTLYTTSADQHFRTVLPENCIAGIRMKQKQNIIIEIGMLGVLSKFTQSNF